MENIQIRSGAKFIVAIAGSIMLMPGLCKNPAAFNMDIDENNLIKVLFLKWKNQLILLRTL